MAYPTVPTLSPYQPAEVVNLLDGGSYDTNLEAIMDYLNQLGAYIDSEISTVSTAASEAASAAAAAQETASTAQTTATAAQTAATEAQSTATAAQSAAAAAQSTADSAASAASAAQSRADAAYELAEQASSGGGSSVSVSVGDDYTAQSLAGEKTLTITVDGTAYTVGGASAA